MMASGKELRLAMTNIAVALKSEISRIARKEVRGEISALKKASVAYRHEIAALKKRLADVERATKRTAKASRSTAPESEVGETHLRFRPAGLAAHRKRLGLSAAQFARLIGASVPSIYSWESGKVRPRAAQLQAIAGVRKFGKKEAAARLAELAAA